MKKLLYVLLAIIVVASLGCIAKKVDVDNMKSQISAIEGKISALEGKLTETNSKIEKVQSAMPTTTEGGKIDMSQYIKKEDYDKKIKELEDKIAAIQKATAAAPRK